MAMLVRRAMPLGLDAGATSLTINAPRYLIEGWLGASALGVFAAIAYLAQTIGMVTGALSDVVVSRLAHLHEHGQRAAFIRLLTKLCAFGLIVSVGVLIAGWLIGEQAIRSLLGEAYADRGLLMLLLLSSAFMTLQRCVSRGLQAAHRFSAILASDVLALVVTVCSCVILVPKMGIEGGAVGLCVGMAASMVAAGYFSWRVTAAMPRRRPEEG